MASISLGLVWNPNTGRTSGPVNYSENRHITLFGPTRSGKGAALEIPNLLKLKGLSIISIDPRGKMKPSRAAGGARSVTW